MILDTASTNDRRRYENLGSHARTLLEGSARHALHLHAHEVSLEHMLTTLMRDDDSAAYRAALHGFADPETIASEALALSPGILVVGSGRSLPFSTLGAGVLTGARTLAAERAQSEVRAAHLLAAAVEALPSEHSLAIESAGYRRSALDSELEGETGETPIEPDGLVLSGFDQDAMRTCGVACRTAIQLNREAIAPAHLLFGVLETRGDLGDQAGLSAMKARACLTGRDADETPPAPRKIPTDTLLGEALDGLPEGADSLELLASIVRTSAELRQLLERHRITAAFTSEAAAAFRDPA